MSAPEVAAFESVDVAGLDCMPLLLLLLRVVAAGAVDGLPAAGGLCASRASPVESVALCEVEGAVDGASVAWA
jgi:hypothetical protein